MDAYLNQPSESAQVEPADIERYSPQQNASASAPKTTPLPKGGMSFDMGRLAVQTQEEYDALPSELKEVLRMSQAGMMFTPESVAQYVMKRREEMRLQQSPEVQASLVKAQVQAASAQDMATTKKAEATDKLQTAYDELNYLDGLIDKVRDHPGFSSRVGWQGGLGALPGTSGKDFDVLLDQIKGKQFMQAYQTLKGGGQITEVEGQKATDALARLNPTQSENSFREALDEYQKIVRMAAERAKEKLPQAVAPTPTQDRTMTSAEYKAIMGREIPPGRYKSKTGAIVTITP